MFQSKGVNRLITKELWERTIHVFFAEPIDYMLAIIGSIVTIPLDLILSPFEVIGLVLYKIFEK